MYQDGDGALAGVRRCAADQRPELFSSR